MFHIYVCGLYTLIEVELQEHANCELGNKHWAQGIVVLV
jgi:hypothetical protein